MGEVPNALVKLWHHLVSLVNYEGIVESKPFFKSYIIGYVPYVVTHLGTLAYD